MPLRLLEKWLVVLSIPSSGTPGFAVCGLPVSKMSHEDEKHNSFPFTQTNSIASSLTHVQSNEKSSVTPELPSKFHAGHGESALPDDKVEEAFENIEEDWENDPENARNWSLTKKWTAVFIVRAVVRQFYCPQPTKFQVAFYTFVTPLASSMMAPGLPEVAQKYGITNSSILALTLSIFLLSFAIGVSQDVPYYSFTQRAPSPSSSHHYLRCTGGHGYAGASLNSYTSTQAINLGPPYCEYLHHRFQPRLRVCTDHGRTHWFPFPLWVEA